MSKQVFIIDCPESAAQFKSICDLSPGPREGYNAISAWTASVAGGVKSAETKCQVGAVQATATITSTGTAANNETMKLCNQTIIAKTSGAVATSGQFNISATPATQAASIALAINSTPALQGLVTATANAGVVTVTAVVPGKSGNGLECADVNLGNVAVAGFSGGSNGTEYDLDLA